MAKRPKGLDTFGILCVVFLTLWPVYGLSECEIITDESFEKRLIILINDLRVKNRMKPLRVQNELMLAARAHSRDMACHEFSSHKGSDGSSASDRVLARGYSFVVLGENIAMGFKTPEEVVRQWMKSSGHRKNILNPSFAEIGSGYVRSTQAPLQSYWTAVFAKRG